MLTTKSTSSGLWRLSSKTPKLYQEGGRQAKGGYPAIHLSDPQRNSQSPFPPNAIYTTKYTFWSFIPKVLWEQFRKVTSAYFLLIAILTSIKEISPINPWTSYVGLIFILSVSAIREGYEDYMRMKADIKVNSEKFRVLSDQGTLTEVPSIDIKVGDLVYLSSDQRVPVDLLLLKTSSKDSVAFIETAQLDGETNLKPRRVATEATQKLEPLGLVKLKGTLKCAEPNHNLYDFKGSLSLDNNKPNTQKSNLMVDDDDDTTVTLSTIDDENISLDENHLLLASSKIRNTEWVIGLCVFSGPETKVGLNLKLPPSKFSTLDTKLNRYILLIFALKITLCLLMMIYNGIFNQQPPASQQELIPAGEAAPFTSFKVFVTYFALMAYLVPLSLVVTLDVVRFMQAQFITWDETMHYKGHHATAKTSNLNDELAMVDYVFSDKTGTLTENEMIFRKASINGSIYDDAKGRDFILTLVKNPIDPASKKFAKKYLYTLALAHSCQVDEEKKPERDEGKKKKKKSIFSKVLKDEKEDKDERSTTQTENDDGNDKDQVKQGKGNVVYKSASPDEEALCKAASENGFAFLGREGKFINVQVQDKQMKFELLVEMPFTSDRRRMSVIVRTPSGKIILYSKGADSVMALRLNKGGANQSRLKETSKDLGNFSTQGLRTLILASKNLTEDDYKEWYKKYNKAANLLQDREKEVEKVCSEIEDDLDLIGATAIEDKLQDGVPQTIHNLRVAGIKVWVITGDKQETAINIGYSCNLLTTTMNVKIVNEADPGKLDKLLTNYITEVETPDKSGILTPFGVVIDGSSLSVVLSNPQLRVQFMQLAKKATSALCCRVTPLQKAEVVALVQETLGVVCLSIGDGGNDVSMIQQADLGIGIKGREGSQAARAADFAVPQFKSLERLLFIHGRYSLLRNTKVIYISFYKNVAIFLCSIWFSFFTGGSGQTLFSDWNMTLYNISYTSLPLFCFGLFEKDIHEYIIEKNPRVYGDQKTLKFSTLVGWLGFGILHSLIIFWGSWAVAGELPLQPNGQIGGHRVFGEYVIAIGFAVVLFKMILETQHIVIWTWVALGVSCANFILCSIIQSFGSVQFFPEFYFVWSTTMNSGLVWFGMIVGIVACLLFDVTAKLYNRQILPSRWMILQEKYTSQTEQVKATLQDDTRNEPLIEERSMSENA